jgi:hypothetical protein
MKRIDMLILVWAVPILIAILLIVALVINLWRSAF